MTKSRNYICKIFVCAMIITVGLLVLKCNLYASTKSEIETGKTYTGQINSDNASDEYKLTLKESGCISFSINVTYALDLKIYDADGNKLDPYFHFGSGDENAKINLKAGSYTFAICRYAKNDSAYQFTTTFKSANETFSYKNDFLSDVSSKAAIPFRTKLNGQLSMDETYAYYKIAVPKKGKLTFNLETNMNQASFSLLNKDGKTIDQFYGYQKTKQYSKDYTLNKGTYYLKVEKCNNNFLGTYSFKFLFSEDSISSFSAKKASNKSFTVTTKKAGSISGYQIKYQKKGWKLKKDGF